MDINSNRASTGDLTPLIILSSAMMAAVQLSHQMSARHGLIVCWWTVELFADSNAGWRQPQYPILMLK